MRPLSIFLCSLVLTVAACGGGTGDRAGGDTNATATPTSAAAEAATAVVNELTPVLDRYRDDRGRLGTLLREARVNDPAWRSSTAEAIERTRGATTEIRQVQPPACLHAAHAELVRSTALTEQAAVFAEAGAGEGNTELLTAAQRRIDEVQGIVDRATEMMRGASC